MSQISRRSYGSFSHERRISKHRVTDEELFNYTLRVALLAYLMQPKPEVQSQNTESERREREYVARLQGAVSNSLVSIGDLFKDTLRDGPKTVQFPEKMLKVLDKRLEKIGMAQDPSFSDALTRRVLIAFWNGTMSKPEFKRQMKDNRKIEDLILMFVTNTTNALKKEPSLGTDGWKTELNNQIATFIRLLRECLRSVHHVPPELISRLDMYTAKLAPPKTQSVYSDSGYDSGSQAGNRDSLYGSPVVGVSTNVSDMPLVKTVAQLFKVDDQTAQREIDTLRQVCHERAALTDLKTCLKNINAGSPFPGRREDFDSDAAWQYWRTLETSHLSQLMVVMVQLNPELAKSTPSDAFPQSPGGSARPGSIYSQTGSFHPSRGSISSRKSFLAGSGNPDAVSAEIDGDDEIQVGHNFTFIPPNPKKYYRRLLEICITADLEAMFSDAVNDDDEVSLGILTPPHIELINECALRWRIGQPYRAACFLDLVKQFYERNDVPLECIPEALQTIHKVMTEIELDKWPIQDSDYLAQVYGGLFNIFLSALYHALDGIPHLKASDVAPYLSILEHVRDSGLLDRFEVDVGARIAEIQDKVRELSQRVYEEKMQEFMAQRGVNSALPLLLMTDEIEKNAKLLDKRFPEPLLGQLDLVALYVEVQIPMYISDLSQSGKRLSEGATNGPTPDVPIQDLFALYRRTKTMLSMLKAFCPNVEPHFDDGVFFEPYVRQWLVITDSKTAQWVKAAIEADKWEAEGDAGHSSSIVDLFDSLRSPIKTLEDLEWSDPYQEARFLTSLAKTISKAVEQYCRSVEELFMAEMYPRPAEFLQPQKSSAWLEKAKQLAITEKKIEVFNFKPESCVKLNNVESARKLLDNLYSQMEADKIAEIIEQSAPPVPAKVERPRFLFTVKISVAEGLVPLDSSPSSLLDTFVTLSDEAGNRLAKTRTIYETLCPRWDETFDLSVDKPLWLMVSVRDRALVGKHDTIGRAYICLDPKRFGDFLTHDLWLDLDRPGRILLRVSMEGEKDDILFFFGRAFRSLKRAEGDMVRIFIDKMSPLIRQTLSRNVLKTLTKTGYSLDYNKALGNVTALYRSAVGQASNEIQVPLPSDEKPRIRPEELTDVQIEQVLAPLFDYFDNNLPTINTCLVDAVKQMVMTRIWKEILTVIEGLLIPPLSDVPSDLKPLTDKEVDIVFKWLKFLRDYFYIDGEGPLSLEELQNQRYRDILSIRLYYDWHSDALMEECVRMMQQTLRESSTVTKRSKSVYNQRNLGTIKDRKREKKKEKNEVSNGAETIMRILRMRPRTQEFIAQQMQIMTAVQQEQEARAQAQERKKLQRPRSQVQPQIPPVPAVPPI
ncbi:hypothetical protein PUNSTDRAFT_92196 [Punctularia strigosozonata HHB-11173 SS5]|uniref:Uncharacterized protein n=1 Tax=Punctularia strigosozonata (strain HHB-11173) TaxID=741275 RepID=R7S4J5_PUNST|nr:uncharacterized protein PUNSTDRAFT_92196 [Punctularia strigosozonata HHB-11173 SS5]EIN05310.1 hypothetical protein PUNSTDRAFT_92196 [Punctularia strigosozonata HHB-11173 SS5]